MEHFLLHCHKYDEERAKLIKEVGVGGMRIAELLGHPRLINHTLESMKNTKRLVFQMEDSITSQTDIELV